MSTQPNYFFEASIPFMACIQRPHCPHINTPKSAKNRLACTCLTLQSAWWLLIHYGDVIMGAIASQNTSLTIVYSTVYLDADQRKHQSSASLAFVWGIHWGPVNSPHKWPVTRKMFPFDDVIMIFPSLGARASADIVVIKAINTGLELQGLKISKCTGVVWNKRKRLWFSWA